MKKEPQQNIDSFIPEGWEFREEYMERALAELNRQRMWMKWKKIGLWSAAAAVVITIGATFLHVCSSPAVLEANRSTAPQHEVSSEHPEAPLASTSSSTPLVDAASASDSNIPQDAPANATISDVPTADQTLAASKNPSSGNASTAAKHTPSTGNSSGAALRKNGKSGKSDSSSADKSDSRIAQQPSSDPRSPSLPSHTMPTVSNPTTPNASAVGSDIAHQNTASTTDVLDPAAITASPSAAATEHLASHTALLPLPQALMLPSSRLGAGSKHTWMLFAGNAMWADYGKTSQTLAWQPIAGIAHRYRIHGTWSLQSQLSYSAIQDPGAVDRRLQVIYDYEQLQSTTQVATKRLHYVNLYSGVHRRLSSAWSAFCGVGAGIKITGNNTITKTDVNNVSTSNEATGYVKGFQRFNLGLNLGVEHALTPQLGIGLQGIVGLTDVSNDAIFHEQKHQSNSQLNLILSYRLQ